MTFNAPTAPKEVTSATKNSDTQTQAAFENQAVDLLNAKTTGSQPKQGSDSSGTVSPAVKSLPNVTITDNSFLGGLERSAEGALRVIGHVGKGAVDEVVNHPGEVLKDVAVGAVIGAVAVTVGPEALIIGGAAVLAGGAMYEVYHHGGVGAAVKAGVDETTKLAKSAWSGAENLAHDAAIDYDPSKYSQADQAKAKAGMESVGAFGAQVAAGTFGGFAGGGLAMLAKGALTATAAAGSAAEVAGSAGADSAAGASAAENLGLVEFPQAAGTADQALALQLGDAASAAGYRSPALYGIYNLTDPDQIGQFASMYAKNYGPVALKNMDWAVNGGRVEQGTEGAWEAALARLGAANGSTAAASESTAAAETVLTGSTAESTAATDTAASAAPVATGRAAEAASSAGADSAVAAPASENIGLVDFPKAVGTADQAFAQQLGDQASAHSFKSAALYGVSELTDPAQIEQFARLYEDNYGAVAVHNMTWSADVGRVADGTEDSWKAAIAKLGATNG